MISFFNLQCELFTSCNVSNNASLVSARIGELGESGQPNVDRPGQGEGESPKFPNLCGHPLWMTPINIAGLYPANLLKNDFLIEFFKGFLINKHLFSWATPDVCFWTQLHSYKKNIENEIDSSTVHLVKAILFHKNNIIYSREANRSVNRYFWFFQGLTKNST